MKTIIIASFFAVLSILGYSQTTGKLTLKNGDVVKFLDFEAYEAPDHLVVNYQGSERKIPWDNMRSIEFTDLVNPMGALTGSAQAFISYKIVTKTGIEVMV